MFYQSHGIFSDVKGWLDGSLLTATGKQFNFSWPIAATFISMTFANQFAVAIYAKLDVYQFAAITLILPWVRIAGQLSYTWTQATGIYVAQLLGKSLSPAALDEFLSRAWPELSASSVAGTLSTCFQCYLRQRASCLRGYQIFNEHTSGVQLVVYGAANSDFCIGP